MGRCRQGGNVKNARRDACDASLFCFQGVAWVHRGHGLSRLTASDRITPCNKKAILDETKGPFRRT
jgi:hypothetical protein